MIRILVEKWDHLQNLVSRELLDYNFLVLKEICEERL